MSNGEADNGIDDQSTESWSGAAELPDSPQAETDLEKAVVATIYIVEDSDNWRRLLRDSIRMINSAVSKGKRSDNGVRFILLDSGEVTKLVAEDWEGGRHGNIQPYDTVLVDHNLDEFVQGLDGEAVAAAINGRAQIAGAEPPLLVGISGHGPSAQGYLNHHLDKKVLGLIGENALGNSDYQDPANLPDDEFGRLIRMALDRANSMQDDS